MSGGSDWLPAAHPDAGAIAFFHARWALRFSRRPSVKALRQLARKLSVSVEYLETGSDLREVDERELRLADAELELRLANNPANAEEKLRTILDEAVAAGDTAGAFRANVALGLVASQTGRNAEAVERRLAGARQPPGRRGHGTLDDP